MAGESGKKSIFAAIGANLAIAITKFIAAWFTGSSAMLSEGIHSTVDTSNELLLLLGIRLSKRPPDANHPFGHGRELYFWTLIVAILIFAVGGGMSVYEGITHLIHPHPIENPTWNYIVLVLAIFFEGFSWFVAFGEFAPSIGEQSFFEAVRTSKDPTIFTILYEDTAALLGLIVALLGIILGQIFNNPYFDGIASIVIGIILAIVAVLLAYESRGLLIGEGADNHTVQHIRRLAIADSAVADVLRLLTLYFGPHEILLNLDIQFHRHLSAEDIAQAIDRIELSIRTQYPDIKYIFIEAQSITLGRNQVLKLD
ncbi:cation diffusion facilitator family transporter [Gloeothece verrucosa]|uniref:Cation diffusion facilitator family transporter n=1 Tax=Gloeothece verrucosa (strain PCC 7822) TaxID=497965 RepID=E0U9I2_GLOV7|nr:cation diffusion facilitator family transporter [Gloeothece verrucosa]ADN12674.1 cation diffusion facilitator family transporter [Gloeothece verrucosa PCC 7822]